MRQLVKTTIYYVSARDFAAINQVYARHMPDPPPARSAVPCSALPEGLLFCIDAIATRRLMSVTSDDVRAAADAIGPYVRTTPVVTAEIDGRPVTLKLENLQVTGSFKFRGALNGVITRGAGWLFAPPKGGATPLQPPGKKVK